MLGGIYEHSPWIAEKFYEEHLKGDKKDTSVYDVRELYSAISSVVTDASTEQKLELLRSHPDLCSKIEKLQTLTKESQEEQTKAGLGSMTDEEKKIFTQMNVAYKEKFGFPFILAARNVTKYTVLSAIEGRVNLSKEAEFAGALIQVGKIAWMRLLAAVDTKGRKGFLTCHVLDTANGCPGELSSAKVTHRLSWYLYTNKLLPRSFLHSSRENENSSNSSVSSTTCRICKRIRY